MGRGRVDGNIGHGFNAETIHWSWSPSLHCYGHRRFGGTDPSGETCVRQDDLAVRGSDVRPS